MGKAFKLDNEVKSLEDETDKAIKEYLVNNPLNALPFEQNADYPYTIQEVSANSKNSSSISRLQLILKVKIDGVKNLEKFEKFVFNSQEEYNKLK